MRILLLCNKLPYPANDGSSIAIAKMIEGFVAEQAEVFVLSLNTVKHHKNPESIPQHLKNNMHFTVVDVNTNPTAPKAFLNLFQKLPFHVSRFFQPNVGKILTQLLRENTFDIVQIEGIFMMPYADIVRANSTAKIALRTHNIEHLIWERTVKSHRLSPLKAYLQLQTRKLKRYELQCAKQADCVVAISAADEAFFAKHAAKTIAIPCGIDAVHPNPNIATGNFFHLGAMDWLPNQQGVDWLLTEVWPLVFAANKNLKLHVAGRAMSEKLRTLKAEGVVIHGEIDDAKSFRNTHGIMLVPLLAGSGIRIKIIEGMAEGIPVISTAIGAEGIPAKNEHDILLANSAQDFANAMLLLANNPAKCAQIGKNAAILAEQNFMNKTLANKLLAFYRTAWQTS